MRDEEKETYGSEIAVGSELLQGGADGNVEEKDPRNSDLLPHLGRKCRSAAYLEEGSVECSYFEIDGSDSGVERG